VPPTSQIQPDWRELFSTEDGPSAGGTLTWRVLRRNGEPLLLLPTNPRRAAAALDLYPAQSPKARAAQKLLRHAIQLRLPLPLERVELALNSTSAFNRFLSAQSETGATAHPAILAGNPRTPGRRFVLLLFGEQNQPARIVKAGIGPDATRLIEREYQFLASARRPGIPEPSGWFREGNINAFGLPYLPGKPPGARDEAVAEKLVNSWIDNSRSGTIGETAAWRALAAAAGQHPLTKHLADVRGLSGPAIVTHGDLAPWNIRIDRAGNIAALDWERGDLSGVPGWDWFHYLVQAGVLVEKLPLESLRRKLERTLESDGFRRYAARCCIGGNERKLLLAYLLHVITVLQPSEGRSEIQSLLAALSTSWTNV
jgi:hypothetical protein